MAAFRALGFFEETPVEVGGTSVVPRGLFIQLASEEMRKGDGKDFVVLRVEVRGERGGEPTGVRYDLLEFPDEAVGLTAMMRCTGFALAIVGLLQLRGQILESGVRTGDEVVPPARFIAELKAKGIDVRIKSVGPEDLPGSGG
jgi:lysine 6-dehydrogenase